MEKYITTKNRGEQIPVDLINGYLLNRHLGDGAFGRTFVATQLKFPREVVIKIPHNLGEFSVAAFLQELGKTTKLRHPGIVTVFDTGTFRDSKDGNKERPYFTMEYLAGETIQSRFEEVRKYQNLNQNLSLFLLLCDAILYAHQLDVYHCDLHAQNILLIPVGPNFSLKIIDFGLPSKPTPSELVNRDLIDLGFLRELLIKYFFFPNINRLVESTIASASISALRQTIHDIVNARFSDRLVFDDAGFVGVSSIEERESRLGKVALMFAKEKPLGKNIVIRIQPFLGADIRWEDHGEYYDVAFYPATSTDTYGSFLLLLSLGQFHFNFIDERIWKYVDLSSAQEEVREFVGEFLSAFEVLILVNMLDRSGFLYEQLKNGLSDFASRQAQALFGVAPEAKIVVYQGLLTRFGRPRILEEIRANEEDLKKLWGFSYFIAKLEWVVQPDIDVLQKYGQAFLDCFYDNLCLMVINSDGKLVPIQALVLDHNQPQMAIKGDVESGLVLEVWESGTDKQSFYSFPLRFQDLVDLYACLLVESEYRLPTSQVYRSGNVTLFGKYNLGLIVSGAGWAFHTKDEKQNGSFFDMLTSLLAQGIRDLQIQPEAVLARTEQLVAQLKSKLDEMIISERGFDGRDFKDEYMRVATCLGRVVTFESKADHLTRQIQRLDNVQADVKSTVEQMFRHQ